MFKGIFPAIITPFKNGSIDEDALREHVDWLIKSGVHGLVPCGTTGEAATLGIAEYTQIVKIVAEEARERCPVVAGAGANSTAKAVELARLVTEAGADATLQVTPYYNKPTQEGLFLHFKTIAAEVGLPHIMYNVPGRTSVNMLPKTVERLSKIKNIAGIKEASGDLKQIETIRGVTPPSFAILSGNDDQNLEIYKRGGSGAISVTANVAPGDVSKVWSLFEEGKKDDAEKLQTSLRQLNDAMFIETNPIPVKTSLSMMGRCAEEFRLPLCPMDSANKKQLQDVLKSYGLAK